MAKNSFWLTLERISRLLINLFISILLARYLGPENYGIISYSMSIIILFSIFTQLGLDSIVIRELISKPKLTNQILGSSTILKITSSFLSVLFILLIVQLSNYNLLIKSSIIILSFTLIFKNYSSIDQYFQSIQANKYPSIANLIALFTIVILNITLVYTNASYLSFIYVILLEAIIVFMILLFYYYKLSPYKSWEINKKLAINFLKESWPIMIVSSASVINMRIDQIYIGNMLDSNTLGNYSVAVKIAEAWLVIPVILNKVLFPIMIQKHQESYINYKKTIINTIKVMFAISLFIALVITFISPDIIQLLYGSSFSKSSEFLSLYIWTGVPYVSFYVLDQVFYIEKIVKYTLIVSIFSIVSNIGLNYILINFYGAKGAILASLFTTFISYVIIFIIIYNKTKIFKSFNHDTSN